MEDMIVIVYYPILVILGIIGNLLSAYVFRWSMLRQHSWTIYLSVLGISDSLALFCVFILWLNALKINIYHKPIACQSLVFTTGWSHFVSVWSIVAFTAERFVAVRFPFLKNVLCTGRRARSLVAFIVLAGAVYNVPLLIFAQVETEIAFDSKNVTTNTTLKRFNEEATFYDSATLLHSASLLKPTTEITSSDIKIDDFYTKIKKITKKQSIIKRLKKLYKSSRKRLKNIRFSLKFQIRNSNKDHNNKFLFVNDSAEIFTICQSGKEWIYEHNTYNVIDTFVTVIVPLIVVLFLNINVIWTANNIPKKLSIRRSVVKNKRRNSLTFKKKAVIARMMIIVSMTCMCLNIPSYVMRILVFLHGIGYVHIEETDQFRTLQHYFQLPFYTNFGINFVLYCISGQNFRKALKGIFCAEPLPATGSRDMSTTTSIISKKRRTNPSEMQEYVHAHHCKIENV